MTTTTMTDHDGTRPQQRCRRNKAAAKWTMIQQTHASRKVVGWTKASKCETRGLCLYKARGSNNGSSRGSSGNCNGMGSSSSSSSSSSSRGSSSSSSLRRFCITDFQWCSYSSNRDTLVELILRMQRQNALDVISVRLDLWRDTGAW